MKPIESLVSDYYNFLKDNTVVQSSSLSGWTQISTPFLDTFNDAIDLYAKVQNGGILLSDDGQTMRNLELSGVPIFRSKNRKKLLGQILLNYGVQWQEKEKELRIEATEANFPQRKFNLLSAIIEINNLYLFSKHTVASAFAEDVAGYFDQQHIIYTPQFISRGSTGLDFTFDFQIASRQSELVIKAFNAVNSMNLAHFLFAWEDIRKARERLINKQVVGLAIINDVAKEVKPEYLEALHTKEAIYMRWSERHKPESISKLQPQAA